MKVFRQEEMQRLDVDAIRHELTRVADEKKLIVDYENDLESQLGKLLRDEVKPRQTPPPDPSPRDKFLKDTEGMHMSPAERTLQSG